MFEAKQRHNLFDFFKIQFIVYKELIYILKKYRYVENSSQLFSTNIRTRVVESETLH